MAVTQSDEFVPRPIKLNESWPVMVGTQPANVSRVGEALLSVAVIFKDRSPSGRLGKLDDFLGDYRLASIDDAPVANLHV